MLLHFAQRVARQRGDLHEGARILERGQTFAARRAERLSVNGVARDNERQRTFALERILYADDGRFADAGLFG